MIDNDRLQRLLSPDVHLRSGSGSGANGTIDACIMQAVDWLAGGNGTTDSPKCADPVIRRFCIRLNDADAFAQWRDELKPFAAKIVGTNGDLALTRKRAFMCADWAIRTIAPMAFDFWADSNPKRAKEAKLWAKNLRDLAPVVDKASAQAGRDAAAAAYTTAAYAATYAAAYTAAYAAAAAYAAYADATRSKADEFSRAMWQESLKLLQRLIDARITETTSEGQR